MKYYSDLFNPRQLLILNIFCDELEKLEMQILNDAKECGIKNPEEYMKIIITYLSFAIDKLAEDNNAHCRWRPDHEHIEGIFSKQTISMSWDYAEINPFQGVFSNNIRQICTVINSIPCINGEVKQYNSAETLDFNEIQNVIVSTDPPYYDNVGYADLSDFFFMFG